MNKEESLSLLIFGDKEGGCAAHLKVLSLVDFKVPNYVTHDMISEIHDK